jgi:GNAT superfamily N-acetyltransferase
MTTLNLNGYTDLPAGKVASVVTYLEMTTPAPPSGIKRADLALVRHQPADPEWYIRLFREIGDDWLWFGRLTIGRDELETIINHPKVDIYALTRHGRDVGLLELDRRAQGDVELAYFGLVKEALGTGAGRWLMDRAIDLAWQDNPRRFIVHTCSYDHPQALEFYRASGFEPYKLAIEVADDPRLTGALPRTASPHIPVIE